MTKKAISIKDINTRAYASRGHEFELEYRKGQGVGVFLTVLGDQAQAVEDFEVDLAEKRLQESLESAQDGKSTTRSTRQTMLDNIERALIRITGWRGVEEEFSPGLARNFLSNNPDFVDQVLAESRKRGNFTKD